MDPTIDWSRRPKQPGRGGGGPAITNIDLLACSDDEVGEDFLG